MPSIAKTLITGTTEVFDAFYRTDRRLAIITCAGGNRNAMTAGAYIALRKRKLIDTPIAFVGVSSGIATNAYFMGGGKATHVRVFSDDMSDTRMFSLRRLLMRRYPFDVDYVERVFRGIETNRGIDAEKVIAHGAPLYAVLAHSETGTPMIYRPESAEDVWRLTSYGTAVTGFAKPLTYKNIPVTDGYFTTEQLPVSWLVKQERPTDILVFAGTQFDPQPKRAPFMERALYASGIARASRPIQELIRTRHVRFMETAHMATQRTDVRVCIVWVPDKLSPVNIDQHTSRKLIKCGYQTMESIFTQRHLHR